MYSKKNKNISELANILYQQNLLFLKNVLMLMMRLKKVTVYRSFILELRILTGKNTLKLNSSAYEKYEYEHLGRWHIKLILFKSSKTETNFPKN